MASETVSWPLEVGNNGNIAGADVAHSGGRPMTLALMPSMTSPVLTTSTTTLAAVPGSAPTTRFSVAARISAHNSGQNARAESSKPRAERFAPAGLGRDERAPVLQLLVGADKFPRKLRCDGRAVTRSG